jgi:osmotically-inducible protein OsmY
MMTDSEVRTAVLERFDAIPSMDASDIDVHVKDGMVTLNGQVDNHQTRFQVERAVRKVPGVRGLKSHITPDRDAS